MTYKEVLDNLFDIIQRHKMIKTHGYGPLTEILVPRGQYETNYPYAFIQPTTHQMSTNATTYRFNLIMMEQCDDNIDNVIKAQSDCHQYIKDILAELYYNYSQFDFLLNVSVTPFKQKYDDVVSGMTASISIEIRESLNQCDAPFEPKA